MFQCDSLAVARTSRWKRARFLRIARPVGPNQLHDARAFEQLMLGQVDFAHAAGADPPRQLVLAELPGDEHGAAQRADQSHAQNASAAGHAEHQDQPYRFVRRHALAHLADRTTSCRTAGPAASAAINPTATAARRTVFGMNRA